MNQVQAQGYLAHFDWGCEAGEHCGWVILEAENKAHPIRVTKVTREDIQSMHESG